MGRTAVLAGARGASPALARASYILRTGPYERQADPLLRSHSENLPDWAEQDPLAFWEAADRYERANGQLYKYLEVSLPIELDLATNEGALREFLADALGADLPYTYAIHAGYGTNPHAHIMVSPRVDDGLARSPEQWFRRANPDQPERGGAPKTTRMRPKQWLEDARVLWEETANRALADAGERARIDHRSYVAREIDLLPQPKIGRRLGDAEGVSHLGISEPFEALLEAAERNGQQITADAAIALEALTGKQSTFSRSELLSFVSRNSVGEEQYRTVLRAILRSHHLVELGLDARGQEHFTTTDVLLHERIVDSAGRLLSAKRGFAADEVLMQRVAKHLGLNDEQHAALRHITGESALALVEGHAGTGKSYMLKAANAVWTSQGYRVVGAAVAGKAAQGLTDSSHIEAGTLHRQLKRWASGADALTDKHVVVVDEAGMVGTKLLSDLMVRVQAAGAKLVLVGDTNQLAAVDAGAPMAHLVKQHGAAVLARIRRQNQQWQRELSMEIAAGNTKEALKKYEAAGCIHAHAHQTDAIAATVDRWLDDVRAVGSSEALMLAYRVRDVAELNKLARDRLVHQGLLSKSTRVAGLDVAPGERLYFLKNDSELQVKNGSLGTVLSVRGTTLRVRLDEGRVLDVDTSKYRHLQHGYAATVHKAQGVTVNRAVVLASTAMNQAASYVALTRHRDELTVHWSVEEFTSRNDDDRPLDLEHDGTRTAARARMLASLSRAQEKRTALEFLDQPLKRDLAEETKRTMGAYRRADEVQRTRMRLEQEALANTPLAASEAIVRVPEYRLALARWADAKRRGLRAKQARDHARNELVRLSKDPSIVTQAETLAARHAERRDFARHLLSEMKLAEDSIARRRELVGLVHALHARGVPARTVVPQDQDRRFVLEAIRRRGPAEVAVLRSPDVPARVLMDITNHKVRDSLQAGQYVTLGKEARWLTATPIQALTEAELALEVSRIRAEAAKAPTTSRPTVSAPPTEGRPSRLEQAERRIDQVRGLAKALAQHPASQRARLASPQDEGLPLVLDRVGDLPGGGSVATLLTPSGETLLFDVTGHDKAMARLRPGDAVRLGKDARWLESLVPDWQRAAEPTPVGTPTPFQQKAIAAVAREQELRASLDRALPTRKALVDGQPQFRAVDEAHARALTVRRSVLAALAGHGTAASESHRRTLHAMALQATERVRELTAQRASLRNDPALQTQADEQLAALKSQRAAQRKELAQLERKFDRPRREADLLRFLHKTNRGQAEGAARRTDERDAGGRMSFVGDHSIEERTRIAVLRAADGETVAHDVTHAPWVLRELRPGDAVELTSSKSGRGVYLRPAKLPTTERDASDAPALDLAKETQTMSPPSQEITTNSERGHSPPTATRDHQPESRTRIDRVGSRLAKLDRAALLAERAASHDASLLTRVATPSDAGTRLILQGTEELPGGGSAARLASEKGETLLFDVTGHQKSMAQLREGDAVRLGKGGRWLEPIAPDLRRVAEQGRNEAEPNSFHRKAIEMVDRHDALRASVPARPYTVEDGLRESSVYRNLCDALDRAEKWERAATETLERATAQDLPVDRDRLKEWARSAAHRADVLAADRDDIRADPAVQEQAKEHVQGLNATRATQRKELAQLQRQLDRPTREAAIIKYLHDLNRRYPDRPVARQVSQQDNGKNVVFKGVRKVGSASLALLNTEQGKRLVQDITHSRWVTKGLQKDQVLQLGPGTNGKGIYLHRTGPSQGRGR